MNHSLRQLEQRQAYNRDYHISYDSEELLDEVREDIELYGLDTHVATWCDPKDNFVKDYLLIDLEDMDEEQQEAARIDKETFSQDKDSEDVYLITLGELETVLYRQSSIL